jgi:Mg2+-importing ATPase
VPGDGVLLDSRELFVTEAPITGESFPVAKSRGPCPAEAPLIDRRCAVHLGTHVMSGSGTAVLVAVGKDTELGRISEHLRAPASRTDFERGVSAFGALLLHVSLVLVLFIFGINVFFARPVLESLLFAVALAVGLTPQLLPAVISVNLAHGARALSARKVIVKRLASIESLGTMRVLCVDKTGTLTRGEVTLEAALGPDGRPSEAVWLHGHLNALHESGYLNPLDQALRCATRRRVPRLTKLDEVPFDFTRKRLSVLLAHRGGNRLITKGAVLPLLDCCALVRTRAGLAPMASWRARLEAQLSALGQEGRRAVGVAVRGLPGRTSASVEDERGMTFLGMLVFADPPKPLAREALAGLSALGVRVKLVTGDHRAVAARVATEVGLSFERVATGAELAGLTEAELAHRAAAVQVFAEVEPAQKERLVLALKRREAVGFLGDGINDAGALHAADVGISVDTAVDVAKDAAQIILLEKDLGVLLEGIRGGRQTFANTLKYVFMATSANFGNMFSMAAASLFLPFLPLLPKQVLLANLLTDLPEMTIATDRVDPEWVARPQRWDLRFIRRFMLVFGWVSSLFDFGTFAVLLWLLGAGTAEFRTGWLVESVVSAALIVLVIRTRRPLWRSPPGKKLALTTLGTVAAALLLPLLPVARALSLVPLPARFYVALLGVVALYVATAELAKRLFYRAARRHGPPLHPAQDFTRPEGARGT